MTQFPEVFAALAAPFGEYEVKTRSQAGRTLSYITARTAMNRLDDVLGPEGWWDEYIPSEHSVLCKLTIRLPDGSTLTKADAGGYAGMSDQGDDDKSGYSDAFKRAAVKFGVARYLYRDGVPAFAAAMHESIPQPGRSHSPPPQREYRGGDRSAGGNGNGGGNRQYDGPPRNGRGLFAWAKDQEQQRDVPLVNWINKLLKSRGIDARIVDLQGEVVAEVYQAAVRKLGAGDGPGRDEAHEEAMAN